MTEQRGSGRVLASLTAGIVIGIVEIVLASSFAALIFGGALSVHLADGVGLPRGCGADPGILAWTAGRRGVVGSVQDGPAVILAVVAASLATRVGGDPQRGRPPVVAEVLADRLGDTLRAVDALSD